MSIFDLIHHDETAIAHYFEAWWREHAQPFIKADVEPLLKGFIKQFTTQFGAQALTESLGAVAALETGAGFASVATGLATTLYADAKKDAAQDSTLDAAQVLQLIQSALQVAKAANNVITPADQQTAAAIAAPTGSSATSGGVQDSAGSTDSGNAEPQATGTN